MECLCVMRGVARWDGVPAGYGVGDLTASQAWWNPEDGCEAMCDQLQQWGVLRVAFELPATAQWVFPAGLAERYDSPVVVLCPTPADVQASLRFAARCTTGLSFCELDAIGGLPHGRVLVYATAAEYALYFRNACDAAVRGKSSVDGRPAHVLMGAECAADTSAMVKAVFRAGGCYPSAASSPGDGFVVGSVDGGAGSGGASGSQSGRACESADSRGSAVPAETGGNGGSRGSCYTCLPGLDAVSWRFPSVEAVAATQSEVTEGFRMSAVGAGVYHVEPDPGQSVRWSEYPPAALVGGKWFGAGDGERVGDDDGGGVTQSAGAGGVLPDAVVRGTVVAAGRELRRYLWQRPLMSFASETALGGCVVRSELVWPLGGRATPPGLDFVFHFGAEWWVLRVWVSPVMLGWHAGMPSEFVAPNVLAPASVVERDKEVVSLPVKVGVRQWLCRFSVPRLRRGGVYPVVVVACPRGVCVEGIGGDG